MRELNCHSKKLVIYIKKKKTYCKQSEWWSYKYKIENWLFLKVFITLIFNILIKLNYYEETDCF